MGRSHTLKFWKHIAIKRAFCHGPCQEEEELVVPLTHELVYGIV